MKKRFSLFSLVLLLFVWGFSTPKKSDDKLAYQLYDKKGKKVSYKDVLKSAAEADIVFFGELHNNPICHWLQLELTTDLFVKRNKQIILGGEFFEADAQIVLDEYLQDIIKESHLKTEAKIWNNYMTDYKPLVEFAKENKLPFIATNIPRRYANIVSRKGQNALADLSSDAKKYICPLPFEVDFELSAYKEMAEMMGGGHGGKSMVEAQASKDATMAHFILKNSKPNYTFIHYNGDFHSKDFQGIVWYIHKKEPTKKVLTISTVEAENVEKPEKIEGLADFILVIPSKMTKTY